MLKTGISVTACSAPSGENSELTMGIISVKVQTLKNAYSSVQKK